MIAYFSLFVCLFVYSVVLLLVSAPRYLQQFQDLYTEEGRKSVKISSYIPSQHHAMIQAQNKNKVKVKAEDNRTPSTCQAQGRVTVQKAAISTNNIINIKGTNHSAISSNVTANNTITVVQQDAVTSGIGQAISAGKISVMGSSSIAGSNGGLVMSGTGPSGSVSSVTVQGK